MGFHHPVIKYDSYTAKSKYDKTVNKSRYLKVQTVTQERNQTSDHRDPVRSYKNTETLNTKDLKKHLTLWSPTQTGVVFCNTCLFEQ